MPEIQPFRGIRYNLQVVEDIADVLCPPYDIVSPTQEELLLNRSPYNAIRLELREHQPSDMPTYDRYSRAASLFKQWLQEDVLIKDHLSAIYLAEEHFTYQGNIQYRQGLITAVRLEEFEKGMVLPHEYTRTGPKLDRLALMNACQTNFSPIMSLYRDTSGLVAELLSQARQDEPILETESNGQAGYKLWRINHVPLLSRIRAALAEYQIIIADGHHRYETALQHKDDLEASGTHLGPNASPRFTMMTLISMDDPGLLLLPYHRTTKGLTPSELVSLKRSIKQMFHEEVIELPSGKLETRSITEAIQDRLDSQPPCESVMGVFGMEPGKAHMLKLRESLKPASHDPPLEKCDVWLLHQRVFRPVLGEDREGATVSFVHDSQEIIQEVIDGGSQIAFLMRPLSIDLFEEVVQKGDRLPPKSTYFHPKLPTGLVINHLVGDLQR